MRHSQSELCVVMLKVLALETLLTCILYDGGPEKEGIKNFGAKEWVLKIM